jgi:hypothetical protein
VKRHMTAAIATVAVALGATVFASAPVSADTVDDPCTLQVTFLCQLMPIAPGVEGDIDLTAELPSSPNAEFAPPADPCAFGCV